jgi:DNA primase
MLSKISDSCRFLLNNFPAAQAARDYLDARLSKESQELFQFGYFPDPDNLKVLTSILGEEVLRKEKILYVSTLEDSLGPRTIKSNYFEHYPVIMPFRDAYGNVVGLVGRTLLSDQEQKLRKISKYKNTKDFPKGNYVFGLYENKQAILDQNCVYVVEGQFDVIKAVEKGFKNIVGLGNNNMTPYQLSVISRYTDNIFLLLDNDEAGEKGRKRTIEKFGRLVNIRNFYLPIEYKDIDEYLSHNSYDSLSLIMKE